MRVYHLSSEQHLVWARPSETFAEEQGLLGQLGSVIGCCRTGGALGGGDKHSSNRPTTVLP